MSVDVFAYVVAVVGIIKLFSRIFVSKCKINSCSVNADLHLGGKVDTRVQLVICKAA